MLFSCGTGSGVEEKSCFLSPPVKTFSSMGGFTTIALSEAGEILQWTLMNNQPTNMIKVNIKNVCSIDSYEPQGFLSSGLALQKNGKVVEWDISHPELMEEIKTEKSVQKISGGDVHAILLFNDGTVGGLGNESWYAGFKTLKDVIDIAAGIEYSIACTKEGNVYVTGKNSGIYLAPDNEVSQFEDAYQIKGLQNIVRVGTTDNQNHYAIDNAGFLYYWDVFTHIAKVDFKKLPEKAKKINSAGYYLSEDLLWKLRPDFKNNKKAGIYLDFESDAKLSNVVDFKLLIGYCLAIKNDGSIVLYDVRNYPAIVNEEVIPELKVDLRHYQ